MSNKVSIQIPTYNQQQYISQAIDSALMQDYPDLEIVVADDCSTDETETVVKKYQDPRVKYFKNEKNIGRVANYRKSLYDYCTGDWVVNLDGDDYFTSPTFISRGMALINEYKRQGHNVMFYQATITTVDEVTGIVTPKRHQVLTNKEYDIFDNYYLNVYRKNKFFSHLTTIYNRETAMRIGFYEYDGLNTDFESISKLSFYGKAILDNSLSGAWRLHAKNATLTTRESFKNGGGLVFDRLKEYAKEAYKNDFDAHWKSKIEKENQTLHLELLAENGSFFTLIKYVLKYKRVDRRTPVIFGKSLINNFKAVYTKILGKNKK